MYIFNSRSIIYVQTPFLILTWYQANIFNFVFILSPLVLVTSYGLDGPDFEFRQEKQIVSFPATHKTLCGAHSTSNGY